MASGYDNVIIFSSVQRAKRHYFLSVGCLVMALMLVGCHSHQTPTELLPPGMAYLKQAPVGRDYEVFLEETYEVSPGVQAYAITGFFYKVSGDTLKTTRCFQAVYTRRPDHRPDWFSFPLELHVLR